MITAHIRSADGIYWALQAEPSGKISKKRERALMAVAAGGERVLVVVPFDDMRALIEQGRALFEGPPDRESEEVG